MVAAAPTTFTPARDLLYVRLLQPAEKTAGGILLPETARVNTQEAEVLAVGPGRRIAGCAEGMRTITWAETGDHILMRKHHFHPLTPDSREGTIADPDVVAVLNAETGEIAVCLGEWVLVEPAPWEERKGSIYIADVDQRRPAWGRILKFGPGRLVEESPWKRHSVAALLDVPEKRLKGLKVWWSRHSEDVMDVGRDYTSGVLVKARDIILCEEE